MRRKLTLLIRVLFRTSIAECPKKMSTANIVAKFYQKNQSTTLRKLTASGAIGSVF